ncbi:response regulator transcription factor [Pontibacter sp. G13]|uniref:response regulator transcription factor n=1 Tax=Pontibacter sp. G13 TaxID=3074898 RepID=UPI00288B8761|nr:response regulator transcription factor [Pontibacter sp. G13]WNJ20453.1 response regulator transcription factor [Pontibacter sp. G13]
MPDKIQVLLVDDHPIYRDGLQMTLEMDDEIEVVGMAGNGAEALAFLSSQNADIVLLDISMPVMNGLETAPKIISSFPNCEILMLTVSNEPQMAMEFLNLDVGGYLLKEAKGRDIIQAIKKVYRGAHVYEESIMKKIELEKSKADKPERIEIALTGQERKVLKHIVEGYTSPDIANILDIQATTVREYRKNLMAKFGVRNAAALVREAIRLGYVDLDNLDTLDE